MWTARFEGGDELARRIDALPEALQRRLMVDALKRAGGPMADRMAVLAPRRTGKLAGGMTVSLARRLGSVSGGRWQPTDEQEYAVAVGPSKDAFYGLFQEYGTVTNAAQPFARPAFDATAPAALGLMRDELWNMLRAKTEEFGAATDFSGGGGTL